MHLIDIDDAQHDIGRAATDDYKRLVCRLIAPGDPASPPTQTPVNFMPLPPDELQRRLRAGVVSVGQRRGFVIEINEQCYIITAAHCLPRLPSPNGGWGSIFKDLLGPLGSERPTVWAECIFVDPVADITVLTKPDSQALYGQADAYDELIDSSEPFALGTFEARSNVHMLGLDNATLITGEAERCGTMLLVANCDGYVQDGMSGSPIVTPEGVAVSLISFFGGEIDIESLTETGPNPLLAVRLPAWLAPGPRH
jgi:hypothetical protein